MGIFDNQTNNTADAALAADKQAQPQVATPTVKAEATSKYQPGSYRADKFMRIIKELTHVHTKDDNGKIQRTHGTWSKPSNMIFFHKGAETQLTAEDLALPVVQRLIDSKTIYRVG